MRETSPTLTEIDLDAFSSNLREIRRWVGSHKQIIPILKADAYGHGSIELSKRAVSDGYDTLGVGNAAEAALLRDAGIEADILVLLGCLEGQEELFVKNRLQPVVYSTESISRLSQSAEKTEQRIGIHIKVDTGMTRLGFSAGEVENALRLAAESPWVVVKGILTHLSSAFMEERGYTEDQLEIMKTLLENLKKKGIPLPPVHISNSAGILFYRHSCFDGVRPGIILYGTKPSTHFPPGFHREPLMTFKTRIIQLKKIAKGTRVSYGGTFAAERESLIAIIPAGYADGYMRSLSNRAQVLVRGARVQQVGTICMDLCMLDVTDLPEVTVDDEVVLFGKQGKEEITVEEVADWAGTIPYEIFCQVGRRVRRVYK